MAYISIVKTNSAVLCGWLGSKFKVQSSSGKWGFTGIRNLPYGVKKSCPTSQNPTADLDYSC